VIRVATPSDAEQVAAVRARAWRREFADLMDVPAALGDEAGALERWRERLGSTVVTTFVWDQAGAVAGFASAGPSNLAETPLHHGMLRALYVDPPAQGAGVGSGLLTTAEEHLRASGFRGAELWTFVDNHAARAFYERRGWAAVPGSESIDPELGILEVCYRRVL
jgi:GNAT superfamily N-acetyltransferase